MRGVVVFAAFAFLPGCDNFQGFTVQNPCDFEVIVEFRYDESFPWDIPETVPAHGEDGMMTASGAGVDSMEVRVSAEGRPPLVETVEAPDDPQVWRIPDSFCRT
jgi:hypothetical protein